ncbi:MAG: glutamate--cysteine ligase, partial [bacterium]
MKSNQYQKKIDNLSNYFRSGEIKSSDFKLGMEIEHFIVNENTMEAVSYYGSDGIEEILNEFLKNNWQGIYEDNHLLGLKGEKANVSLEPGGQVELSLYP